MVSFVLVCIGLARWKKKIDLFPLSLLLLSFSLSLSRLVYLFPTCCSQVWNHTFYWNSMSPQGGGSPSGELGEMIQRDFGSYETFQKKFTEEATKHFGSGWAWLVLNGEGKLAITSTHDAANPIQDGLTPLLTCDVWEHAYYVDYRNARPKYLDSWWKLVNWKFAENNIKAKKSL